MGKKFIIIGAIFGALAVAIGAYGAHAGAKYLNEVTAITFSKAVRYQMYHTFALLVVGLMMHQMPKQSGLLTFAGSAFITGIVLFSGSLYLIIFAHLDMGYITPTGGTAFILGWFSVAYAAWREGKS
jgi:uncharacterized membrane protein YgdD (TMEM256/DUF423 family)